MRTTGSMARRWLAGAFLAFVMSLALAGVAGAQTGSGSGSGSGAGGTTTTSTTIKTAKTAGTATARTGTNMVFLLLVGGGLTAVWLGARRLGRAVN